MASRLIGIITLLLLAFLVRNADGQSMLDRYPHDSTSSGLPQFTATQLNNAQYQPETGPYNTPMESRSLTKGLTINGPSPINAGRERVTFTAPITLSGIIRNPFDEVTIIDSIRFAGTGIEFTLQTPIRNRPLSPGATLSVPIYFSPGTVCARRDTLIVYHNAPDSPLRVPVVGTGTEPGFSTDPKDTLDFGNVVINIPSDRILKIRNSKPGSCLDSTRIASFQVQPVGGEFSTSFTLGAPIYLQPDDTLAPLITITALSTGPKIGRALIEHEILGGSVVDTVILLANAVQPAVTPVRNDIVFAPTDIGGWRDTLALKFLRNFSGADVQVLEVTVRGTNASDFVYTGPATFQISTGTGRDLPLTFLPGSAGTRTAILDIRTNIPSTISINLSGNAGSPAIAGRRQQIVFDPTAVNDCRDTVVTSFIINKSLFPLRIKRFRIGGVPSATNDDSLAFTVVSPLIPPDSLLIRSGDSAAVILRFCPRRPGAHRARLFVESNADSTLIVQLIGPAQAGNIQSADSIIFAPTRVLTIRDTTFSRLIFNNTAGRLDITSMSITGADALSFQLLQPLAPFSIEGGHDTTVVIRFQPKRRGRHIATLQLATSLGSFGIALRGEAIYPFLEIHPEDPAGLRARVNSSRQLRIDITNAGDDSARIEAATIVGSTAFTNVSAGPFPARLLPGETLPLFVDFEPHSLCDHEARVELRGEGIRGIYDIADTTVQFIGVGTSPFVASRRDEISFGTRLLNSVNDTLLTDFLGNVDFTGTVSACLDSTHIDSLVIVGQSAGSYRIILPIDPLLTQPLPSGNFLPFSIEFTPQTNGLHSATLLVYFDGVVDSTRSIRLVGAGSALPLRYGPAPDMLSIDFGKVTLDTHRDSVFTATNISETPISVDSVSIHTGNDFYVITAPVFPVTMEPGVPVEFKVQFRPTGIAGERYATVAFHALGVTDTSFGLFGTATATQLDSRIDTLDFGLRSQGSVTDSSVLLTNVPGGQLTRIQLIDTARIDRMEIIEGRNDFQVVAFPLIITPGDSDKVIVRFTANGIRGVRQGRLRIYHNLRGTSPTVLTDSLDIILRGSVDGPAFPIQINLGPDIVTEPGEHIRIPVVLGESLDTITISNLSLVLSYPKSLVRPIVAEPFRTGISITMDTTLPASGKAGRVGLTVTTSASLPADTIIVMDWLVLLGDTLQADVTVDSVLSQDRNDLAFLKDSASVSIEEYCNANRRLIRFDSLLTFAGKPNPASGQLIINYSLPAIMEVHISIYDPLGREINRIVDGELQPGTYSDELDLRSFDSGVYHIIMQAGLHSRAFTLHVVR